MTPAIISRLVGTFWCHFIEGVAVASAQEAVQRKPKTYIQKELDELNKRLVIVRVPKTK
jgi:hypothetical protein|uniref:Uncharacterized protein n=1 Tax=Siphoviridae sp. ctHEr2 TaxID=2826229 RepID=A0A8S5NG52_9CAUD|nr:MAG TPA: hypothetical protein [Siphoviridae sp. ctHEr2]